MSKIYNEILNDYMHIKTKYKRYLAVKIINTLMRFRLSSLLLIYMSQISRRSVGFCIFGVSVFKRWI